MDDENPGQPSKIVHSSVFRPDIIFHRIVVCWIGSVLVCTLVSLTVGVPPDGFCIGSVIGVCSGLVLGLFQASAKEMPSDKRRMLFRYALVGGVIGVALCGGLPALLFTSPQHRPRVGDVVGVALLGLGFGLVLGLVWGVLAVNARLDREKRAFEGRLDEAATARDAMEAAITSKFGPLDEARREAIRAWDDSQIADAARRLPEARSLDDLG